LAAGTAASTGVRLPSSVIGSIPVEGSERFYGAACVC